MRLDPGGNVSGPRPPLPSSRPPESRSAAPDSTVQSSAAAPTDAVNVSSKSRLEPVIIIPQTRFKGVSGESLMAQANRELKSMRVRTDESIPFINAFTAHVDEKTRKSLEKAGYQVMPDRQEYFVPKPVWKESTEPSAVKGAGKPVAAKVQKFTPRPQLTEPRFDTPLTRQYTGEGVGIAIVDTGLYPHPDFTSPSNRIVAFHDAVNGRTVPYDDDGHGTHVAGDAAGNGHLSNGLYKGPAPKADLVGVKVLGPGGGQTSNVIKGLAWVLENKDKYNIRVVNMSLGHEAAGSSLQDPVDMAVAVLTKAGILVVAAAGNEGPNAGTVGAPGDSPFAVTVGAADDRNTPTASDDTITPFSSRGPTLDKLDKPDLVAPGEAIIAPNVPGSGYESEAKESEIRHKAFLWLNSLPDDALMKVPAETLKLMGLADTTIARMQKGPAEARKELDRLLRATSRMPLVETSYIGMPGTSMASPIVAGVAAQLIGANPKLTPDEVKAILLASADPLPKEPRDPNLQGAGMVDPDHALRMALKMKEGASLEQALQLKEPPSTRKKSPAD